ncbi:MAG: hypothetical protein ACRYG8_06390 [Janthinobacterium lividum]
MTLHTHGVSTHKASSAEPEGTARTATDVQSATFRDLLDQSAPTSGKRNRSELMDDAAPDTKRSRGEPQTKHDHLRSYAFKAPAPHIGTPVKDGLARYGAQHPEQSALKRLAGLHPDDALRKVDAPNQGDHSPSVSAMKNVANPSQLFLRGRSTVPAGVHTIPDHKVPALSLDGTHFRKSDGSRDTMAGSAAHTAYTTLREIGGVGETAIHPDTDTLRDKTMQAYSPYRADGEIDRGNTNLPKTHVSEASKQAPFMTRHPVDPMIGQGIINIELRRREP